MPKPTAQYVNCIHCTRGPKGEPSCAAGQAARTVNGGGCFLGAWIPGKEPRQLYGQKVERVEATSYREAWHIAQEAGYPQWIWVCNGIPGESR